MNNGETTGGGSADLLGRTFGNLTVVGKSRKRVKQGRCWTCLCACGYTCDVAEVDLAEGKTTHCGCKTGKNYADITGQRFGSLTALYPTQERDKKGYVVWHCRCDCGREVEVPYNSMVYANQISCGCKQKAHMATLGRYLTHVEGTSIDAIRSKKIPTDNTTGYKGVYLVRGKYMAKIVFRKKQYFLGTYDTIEAAAQARKEAEEVLFDGVAEHYRLWKEKADSEPAWAAANPVEIHVTKSPAGHLSVTCLPQLPSP